MRSSLKETGKAKDRPLWLLDVGKQTPTKTFAGTHSPTWAPDGSTFAFLHSDDGGLPQIFTASRDGSRVSVLS